VHPSDTPAARNFRHAFAKWHPPFSPLSQITAIVRPCVYQSCLRSAAKVYTRGG
jgi:hypothetical protein